MAVSIPESLQRVFGDATPDFIATVRQIASESQISREDIERLAREQQAGLWSEQAEANREARSRSRLEMGERDLSQLGEQIKELRQEFR